MKTRFVVSAALLALVILAPGPATAGSHGLPMGAVQWVISDLVESGSPDWKLGMGFNLAGSLPVSQALEVRADWGGRWLEGENRLITNPDQVPRWGGRAGETTDGLRVMPATIGLVYRLECLSRGRFWVPYVGAGPGLYDMRATFLDSEGTARDHTLSRLGWHARTGVRWHRTSGLHVSLETAVHFIDTPGKMTPMWEAALGLGSLLPGGSR